MSASSTASVFDPACLGASCPRPAMPDGAVCTQHVVRVCPPRTLASTIRYPCYHPFLSRKRRPVRVCGILCFGLGVNPSGPWVWGPHPTPRPRAAPSQTLTCHRRFHQSRTRVPFGLWLALAGWAQPTQTQLCQPWTARLETVDDSKEAQAKAQTQAQARGQEREPPRWCLASSLHPPPFHLGTHLQVLEEEYKEGAHCCYWRRPATTCLHALLHLPFRNTHMCARRELHVCV